MKDIMDIGIFRGSYDPPHMGHVFAAVYALKAFDLDEIWVIPVCNHPFGKQLSPYSIRCGLVVRAFSGMGSISPRFYDDETLSGHCIDLLKRIHMIYPGNKYVMLGGTDVDSQKGKYRDEEEILKLCTVARVPRDSYSESKYAIPNYSSSEIKQRVKEGLSITGLVPKNVEEMIISTNLYKELSVVSKSS